MKNLYYYMKILLESTYFSSIHHQVQVTKNSKMSKDTSLETRSDI